jgi:Fe-S oxidoreductase
MARLKSEFLQGYHDRHGPSLRDRLIANLPRHAARWAGPLAPLANYLGRLGRGFAGFSTRRALPLITRHPFAHRATSRSGAPARRVVLFDDTYLNYFEPHVGRAAVELLESCGYEVTLARAGCCQRPRISQGFLREARQDGEQTLRNLDALIQQGLEIIVCEPSCASALTDDLPDLIDDEALGRRIREHTQMIDVYLAHAQVTGPFTSPAREMLIHGHCHQKALYGTAAMKQLLGRVPGLKVGEVDSGCCGMAGAFGYEQEHVELSRKIGERRLFPALRALPPDTTVVACGFSCRHQIKDCTGIEARHWVEILRGTHAH